MDDMTLRDEFWTLPLETLNDAEWEALCDGCGLCCLNKIEDADTGRVYATNVACNLLDLRSCRCSRYAIRQRYVPECIKLDYEDLREINWLPETCAYRRRYENEALPEWHYLLSGDKKAVHRSGITDRKALIPERRMKKPLEYYITEAIDGEDD